MATIVFGYNSSNRPRAARPGTSLCRNASVLNEKNEKKCVRPGSLLGIHRFRDRHETNRLFAGEDFFSQVLAAFTATARFRTRGSGRRRALPADVRIAALVKEQKRAADNPASSGWFALTCQFKGQAVRWFRMAPVGRKQALLQVTMHRLQCARCGCLWWPRFPFVKGNARYTRSFALTVLDLLQFGTIRAVADSA